MYRTKLKFAEAEYFLGRIRDHYHDILTSGEISAIPLVYYVSAFVSAARSVTWILRAEYGAVDGWDAWWDSQTPSPEQARVLSVFAAIRNRSQKAEPLRLGFRLQAGKPTDDPPTAEHLVLPARYQVVLTRLEEDGSEGQMLTMPLERLEMELPELGEDDLYLSCKAYLELIADLLARCEAQFGVLAPE